MKLYFLISFMLIIVLHCEIHSQVIRHPEPRRGSCNHCDSLGEAQDVVNGSLINRVPYNNIFHLSFKWNNNPKQFYGGASFISKDVMITARHCVNDKEKLEFLEFTLPMLNNKWIMLKRGDFEIFYYTPEFKSFEDDIALIKITNKSKLRLLYRSHFAIDSTLFSSQDVGHLNISGYPFNKFAINSFAQDTLVNRKLKSNSLEFNTTKDMVGHQACVCNGDSGGPMWYQRGENFYLFGINQGSKSEEAGFEKARLNIGVLALSKISWIKSITGKVE